VRRSCDAEAPDDWPLERAGAVQVPKGLGGSMSSRGILGIEAGDVYPSNPSPASRGPAALRHAAPPAASTRKVHPALVDRAQVSKPKLFLDLIRVCSILTFNVGRPSAGVDPDWPSSDSTHNHIPLPGDRIQWVPRLPLLTGASPPSPSP
jgi:hypothetical protein